MIANPNWPEIQMALLEFEMDGQGVNANNEGGENPNRQKTQQSWECSDIVTRVFNEKKDALLTEIKDGLFGKVSRLVYTTEFQRGACHIFISWSFLRMASKSGILLMLTQLSLPNFQIIIYSLISGTLLYNRVFQSSQG
jgi:hypothetical protein